MSEPSPCRMNSSICPPSAALAASAARPSSMTSSDCDQSVVVVVIESTRLVIDDLVEMRHPVGYRKDLVDLLLILRRDKLHVGMSEDVSKLVSHRIRIDRNRNRAQRLRCHQRPIELRPVGTNDGDRVSWLQSKSLQARSIITHYLGNLSPGPRLPDAKILMPKRRTAAKLRGISQQQFGERVKRSANGHVGLHPKTGTLVRACLGDRALRMQPCEFRMLLHNTRDRMDGAHCCDDMSEMGSKRPTRHVRQMCALWG